MLLAAWQRCPLSSLAHAPSSAAAVNDDNSVIVLHPKTMETLELFRGDTVLLKVG